LAANFGSLLNWIETGLFKRLQFKRSGNVSRRGGQFGGSFDDQSTQKSMDGRPLERAIRFSDFLLWGLFFVLLRQTHPLECSIDLGVFSRSSYKRAILDRSRFCHRYLAA